MAISSHNLEVLTDGGAATAPGTDVRPYGLAEVDRVTRARPEAGAILVATELSTGLLQQALRWGVRDVLGPPTEPVSLHESVERVSRTLTSLPSLPPLGGEAPARGHVITVASTKGGSGKSVV